MGPGHLGVGLPSGSARSRARTMGSGLNLVPPGQPTGRAGTGVICLATSRGPRCPGLAAVLEARRPHPGGSCDITPLPAAAERHVACQAATNSPPKSATSFALPPLHQGPGRPAQGQSRARNGPRGSSAAPANLAPSSSARRVENTVPHTRGWPPAASRGRAVFWMLGTRAAPTKAHHRRAHARRPQALEAAAALGTPARFPARLQPGHCRSWLRPHHSLA